MAMALLNTHQRIKGLVQHLAQARRVRAGKFNVVIVHHRLGDLVDSSGDRILVGGREFAAAGGLNYSKQSVAVPLDVGG